MSNRHLHIISLDVPWPPNYGGVIDIYYKARALTEAGVKVHLHCFMYGRPPAEELNFCYVVHYYQRETLLKHQLGLRPYIVASRQSEMLLTTLLKDEYPILCEGLHTTALLSDRRFATRKVYVRVHNVEHDYYRMLARAEKSWWKRIYYAVEAARLRNYESVLLCAQAIFPISQTDVDYFSKHYDSVRLLPAFSAVQEVQSCPGHGSYVLYHGNLSVRENEEAAIWLIHHVFAHLKIPCVIAGLNPSTTLLKAAAPYSHVEVRANPDEQEMTTLLRDAQVNILITHQPTGLKLKLLHALRLGRFCLVNAEMLSGTTLDELCVQADDAPTMVAELNRLMQMDFSDAEVGHRRQVLNQHYSNANNAQQLIEEIFGCAEE